MTQHDSNDHELPQAIECETTLQHGVPGLVLGLSVLALIIAGFVTYYATRQEGLVIRVLFPEGGGLKVGDALRHRGVLVGEVTELRLTDDLSQVQVVAVIHEDAKLVASEGTRFWIVRPEASIKGITGLDTIVGGQYITVDPSRRKPVQKLDFVGLSGPPATELPGDALEIVLEARELDGLQPAAPVLYRGMEVGRIQSVGLSPDSRWVRVAATIKPDYRALIRDNTKFWNISGLRMNMGLTGLALQTQTLANIAMGGVEFSTPEPPGKQVAIGHRFELHSEPESEWQEWQTAMPAGAASRLELEMLPPVQMAAVSWKTSFYGLKRSHQTTGWVLPLNDGTLLGPKSLFVAPADAVEGSATWECAGKSWMLKDLKLEVVGDGQLARVKLPTFPQEEPTWPAKRLGNLDFGSIADEEILLLCEGDQRYVPLEKAAFRTSTAGLELLDSALPQPIHGAAIVRVADQNVVGIVVQEESTGPVQVIPLAK